MIENEEVQMFPLIGEINDRLVILLTYGITPESYESLYKSLTGFCTVDYHDKLAPIMTRLKTLYPMIEWSNFKPFFNEVCIGRYDESEMIGSYGLMLSASTSTGLFEVCMIINQQGDYDAYHQACDTHGIKDDDRCMFVPVKVVNCPSDFTSLKLR